MSGPDLLAAGRALAAAGLVTAFGHVSERVDGERLRITPPRPLGRLGKKDELREVDLNATALPPGTPGEAWIHVGILGARRDIGAVCRAQPPLATAAAAAGVAIRPLHGQGAFLGREAVPVHDDARLVRARAGGDAVAVSLGAASAVILRGNGAVTTGTDIGEAVARMWVLEASAALNLQAATAGAPQPLRSEEIDFWTGVAPEILGRIYAWMRGN